MTKQANVARRGSSTPDYPDRRSRAKRGDSGISTSVPRIEAVLMSVRRDYQCAARQLSFRIKAAEESVNELKYLAVAAAFEHARQLEGDDDKWQRFVCEDCPPRDTKYKREDCLRYAIMYFYRSFKGPIGNCARDHARALDQLWREGASALEVYDELKRCKFSGLKDAGAEKSTSRLRGRTARQIYVRKLGCRKLDALGRNEDALIKVRKVAVDGKLLLRCEWIAAEQATIAEFDKLRKGVKRATAAVRGRRRA